MNYLDGNGEEWSIEKGDWISHQYFDAEEEKTNFKEKFSTAYFIMLFLLIAVSLFIMT